MILADLRGKTTITDLIEVLRKRLLETHDPHETIYAVSSGRDVDICFGKPWDEEITHVMMTLYPEYVLEEDDYLEEIREEWEDA